MAYDQHPRFIVDDGSGANPPNAALGSTSNPLTIIDGFGAPVALTWTSATPVNTANTLTTTGYDGVMISVVTAAGITGGTLVFEVYDGAAWIPAQAGKMNGYGGQTSVTLSASLSQGFQINTAGCQQFRTRLSGAITGTGNVVVTHAISSANMPDPVTVGLDPSQPLPAGGNNIGWIFQAANFFAGKSYNRLVSAASTNATNVKTSAAGLFGYNIVNTNASARYVKFYNLATAPTVGSSTVALTVMIPGSSQVSVSFGDVPLSLGTGLSFAMTANATDTDATAVGAGDLIMTLLFA